MHLGSPSFPRGGPFAFLARLPFPPFLRHARRVGPFRQGKPIPLPTPELDAYEKELRARSHRKVTYAGIACIGLVSPLVVLLVMGTLPDLIFRAKNPLHGLSTPVRTKVGATVAEARATATREETALREGVSAAIRDGVEAHPELGRCPYTHAHTETRFDQGLDTSSSFARMSDPELCTACRALRLEADALERTLTEKTREKDFDRRTEQRLAKLDGLGRYSVVLNVTSEGAPSGIPHQNFISGHVRGRAYVWDTRTHRVVCAGDVFAESSEVIDYTYTTRDGLDVGSHAELDRALKADLRKQTTSAVADALRYMAGPRIVPE